MPLISYFQTNVEDFYNVERDGVLIGDVVYPCEKEQHCLFTPFGSGAAIRFPSIRVMTKHLSR